MHRREKIVLRVSISNSFKDNDVRSIQQKACDIIDSILRGCGRGFDGIGISASKTGRIVFETLGSIGVDDWNDIKTDMRAAFTRHIETPIRIRITKKAYIRKGS
jgi:hypothetical protein